MERAAAKEVFPALGFGIAVVPNSNEVSEVAFNSPMQDIGKLLVILGLLLTLAGAVLWKTGGFWGLGRLPGDLLLQKGNSTFFFPIVTCLLISAGLTLIMWLLRR